MIKKQNNFITNTGIFIVVFVMLVALGKCFIYQRLSLLLFVCFLVAFLIAIKESICITIYDIFVWLSLIMILINKSELYLWTTCLYVILAVLSYYAFRTKQELSMVLKFSVFFSLINIVVNIISWLNKDLYYNIAEHIFPADMFEYAVGSRENGLLTGLAEHYSRNAYFCVVGATVFAAAFFEARKEKKLKWVILLFAEILMIMIIGKRGHLLFFLAALGFVYLLLEPGIIKKASRFIKVLLIICLFLGAVFKFVPAASAFIDRTILQIKSGDISTGRFGLWKDAWHYFLERPVFGWGYGFFTTHVFSIADDSYFAGVHNDYLQWLCEGGIIGFLINITITIGFYSLSMQAFRHIHKNKQYKSCDRLFITWSVLFQTFVILYSLTGLPHFDFEVNILYWISCSVPMIYVQEVKPLFAKKMFIYWR